MKLSNVSDSGLKVKERLDRPGIFQKSHKGSTGCVWDAADFKTASYAW